MTALRKEAYQISDKLVILGDLLRINVDWSFHQSPNITWMEDIFKESLGYHFTSVQTCCDPVLGFPFEEFYQEVYQDRTLEPETAWAALFDTKLSKKGIEFLESWIGNRFVLIFEGSPIVIRALSELDVSILNVRLHPYRCGDDLFLAFSSNNPAIAERLKQASLNHFHFKELSQKICQRYDSSSIDLASDCFIFLAQTDSDAVLIQDGRFFSLASTKEEILKLAQGRTPYHKPHPSSPDGRLVREWLALFPDSIALGPDLYRLFATDQRLTFVTASSGSAFEAEAFGHTAHYLMSRNWGSKGGLSENYQVIPQYYWDPRFWDFILNGKSFNAQIPDNCLPHDRLRNTINYHWAPLSWRK